MHSDAGKLESGSLIEGDICIVGAGAAGIAMALQWIDTPYKVILLEGGGFDVDMRMQDLYRGKSIGQRYFPLHATRLHYFGGTTGHWAGFCSRFDPIDFEKRDWVAHSGWPIHLSDLDPYYKRSWPLVELDSDHYNVDYWCAQDPELVPLPLDESVVWNKIYQFSPPTRFGKLYRKAIVNAPNIWLYTHANVVDIVANEPVSKVTHLRIRNFSGKEHTVRAKYFVMACCALQNARMLLASNRQAPRGIGNDHDLVGRFFMEHLELKSAELLMPSLKPMKLYRPWAFKEVKVRAELAISEPKQRDHRMLNGTASLIPKKIAANKLPNIDAFSEDVEATVEMWDELESKNIEDGRDLLKGNEGFLEKHFELFTRMEQAPNPDSRIRLDQEKDELGVPRMILDWKLTHLDKMSIRELYNIIGQEVGRAGVGRIRLMDWLQVENNDEWPPTLGGGWHHMGTTRMADNSRLGVVDSDCKVFNIANLFMAGSSCFATSGAANPTLTLIALTLRLSDHLKRKLTDTGVPTLSKQSI